MYNRCQTFQQREFNFISGEIDPNILKILQAYPFVTAKILEYTKPGSPLSLVNLYVAQCNPNNNASELAFISAIAKSMIDKGYITSRAMAIYFGITHTSAYYLIKELKQNINKLQYRYEVEPSY